MRPNATSHLEIDFGRLEHNLNVIRKSLRNNVGLCCVIKADAYGLGAAPIAARLNRIGVEMFAVFTPEQARELIQAGIHTPILILMPLRKLQRQDLLYRAVISGKLECVVHDSEHLEQLISIAESFGSILPLHVEIDTGMSRGGMNPDQAKPLIKRILNHRRLHLAGIMSHFATTENNHQKITEKQARQFLELIQQFEPDLLQTTALHLANTHACFNFGKRFQFDLVRLGLAWIGYGNQHAEQKQKLLPIVRWLTTIIHTKWVEPQTPVGYGSTYHTKRKTRLGLIPVGYADGYPLALSNIGIVRVCCQTTTSKPPPPPNASRPLPLHHDNQQSPPTETWHEARVIGRVSMDQIIIDLTDLPQENVGIHNTVELLSNNANAPNSLEALAELAGSIPYQILCGINAGVPRRYLHHQFRIDSNITPHAEINTKATQSNQPALTTTTFTNHR